VIFYIAYTYFSDYTVIVLYLLIGIIAPVLYVAFIGWDAKKKKDFSKLGLLLKLIMIAGILSIIPIYYYALKGF